MYIKNNIKTDNVSQSPVLRSWQVSLEDDEEINLTVVVAADRPTATEQLAL